jgi:hypothetical protein
MRWLRVRYRVKQFIETLMAWRHPVDIAYAAACLAALAPADSAADWARRRSAVRSADRAVDEASPLVGLFLAMARADQLHGIAAAHALEEAGFSEPALLGAALLHDVGKTVAPPGILARVVTVLGERAAPVLARRWACWAEGDAIPRGLRRGFVVRRHHPAWGAALVDAAGAPERMTMWIRRHHDPPEGDTYLAALQRADEGII